MASKDKRVGVLSMDIHTKIRTGVEVEVWTRPGSFADYTHSMDGWVKLSGAFVSGNGRSVSTLILQQDFTTVEILAYQSQSFYVTLKSDNLLYTNGGGLDTSDDALIIYEGVGIYTFPLQQNTVTYYPRVFKGNINYVAY